MNIRFSKMHGLGNDFIVIDAINQNFQPSSTHIRFLADRHFGVGADQILLVERPTVADADFRYRIFNADGSEVEHCGNGARCFARFVIEQGLVSPDIKKRGVIRAQIATGILLLEQLAQDFRVDMGEVNFSPEKVPFNTQQLIPTVQAKAQLWPLQLEAQGQQYLVEVCVLSISNPHAVLLVDNIDHAPVTLLGPLIENHPRFPQRVNVGFMQIIDRHNIRLRVYERGAGETLACGTGACAAVAAGIQRGLLDSPVKVAVPGSELSYPPSTGLLISFDGIKLSMIGPATQVFEGSITLE